MVSKFMDQASQAFARADLGFVLETDPEPNRPTQTPTSGQQASAFNFLMKTMSSTAMDVAEVERAASDPRTSFTDTWKDVVTGLSETEHGQAEAADSATAFIRELHTYKLPQSGTLSTLANKLTSAQRQLAIVGKELSDGDLTIVLMSALKGFNNFGEVIRSAASNKGTDRQLSHRELLKQLVNIERLDEAAAATTAAKDTLFASMREQGRLEGMKEAENAAIRSLQQADGHNSGSFHSSGRGKQTGGKGGGKRKPRDDGEDPPWKKARDEDRTFRENFDYFTPTRKQPDGVDSKALGNQVLGLTDRQQNHVRDLVREVEKTHAEDLLNKRAKSPYFEAIIRIWKKAVAEASGNK